MADLELQNDENRGRTLDNEHWSDVLIQAMPYFKQWVGKTVVVKYGGNAMLNEELKQAVMKDIVLLHTIGINIVLVHGGGPEINKMLEKVGKEQLLGADCQTLFCRVELDNPIALKENTFYARQCKVAAEVSEMSVEAGAKRGISGNLNALEDIVVGEFNTQTKTFTPASQA